MQNYKYNPDTDDFDLQVTPDELNTMEAWLQEARRGIVERMQSGYLPHPQEESLLRLQGTLDQFRELQEWRKGVHVE